MIRRLTTLTIAAALIARVAGAQAAAPDTAYHRGFWLGLGFGPGRVQLDCEANCGAPDPIPRTWRGGTGGGFTIALGGTPRPNLLLGAELGTVLRPQSTNVAGVGWMSVVTQVYPRANGGLFLRPGLGIGVATLDDERLGTTGEDVVATTGFSAQLGVGYDVRLGRRSAMTPFAQYVVVLGEGEEIDVRGRHFTGPSNPSALLVGVSFVWY